MKGCDPLTLRRVSTPLLVPFPNPRDAFMNDKLAAID